jgi:hypothetical protein
MDVLVRLDDGRTDSLVLAHVNSLPTLPFGGPMRREVVTLYGSADADALALALAASVESAGDAYGTRGAVRQLEVWSDRGAAGDAAWRDAAGALVTRDVAIPMGTLRERAAALLGENGPTLRRVAAELSMPDWPEGADRALSFTLVGGQAATATGGALAQLDDAGAEHWLESWRLADALGFDVEGD